MVTCQQQSHLLFIRTETVDILVIVIVETPLPSLPISLSPNDLLQLAELGLYLEKDGLYLVFYEGEVF